jgi:hypothetical protein
MNQFEELSVVVAATGVVVNALAAGFVGLQVRLAAKQSRLAADTARQAAADEKREWDRRRQGATVSFITSTMQLNKDLKAALPFLDRDPERAAEFIERAESEPVVANAIRAYLDYLENIATGVNMEVLDLDVVARMQGGRITAVARNYAPYIAARRRDLQSTTLYSEVEELARRIEARRRTS